jgi:putative membrane protein
MRLALTTMAVACGMFALQAVAQNATQDFVTKVAISDMFEIQTGKLAAQKGNAEVKSFGQRMVKDHTKTSQELKSMLGKSKVKVPTALDAEHRAKLGKLEKLSGDQFNSNYASMQVEAHQEAVKLFETYSSSGDDAELKAWAAKTLPTLKDHLEHARKLK